MNDIIPKYPLDIHPATIADLPFIDALQRKHSKNVGWMQTKAIERKIELGEILIAEENGQAIGYCMGVDRYMKRDDVGIIYQMNVVPGKQRGLIGASLLKAQFEKSAYGCKLYCCWCAQDIEANKFWEAMGFVPLAYRTGSEAKSRTHIFWQKRIRRGDVTTPYWFPAHTTGGSIREDRLVLPIPPGTHWSDAKPMVLPKEELPVGSCQLPGKKERVAAPVVKPQRMRRQLSGGLWFAPPVVEKPKAEKVKEPKKKRKNDPRLVAAARELRDRWLEQVNGPEGAALLDRGGKYDVTRAITGVEAPTLKRLAA